MIIRLVGALFAPRYPRHYTGRHRMPGRMWAGVRPDADTLPLEP